MANETKETFKMKITCVCPCWHRPKRTLRAIESVLAQKFQGWEAIFIGDACPFFLGYMKDGTFEKYSKQAEEQGNRMIFISLEAHYGGWGHVGRQKGIELATGKYICFLDNDDMFLPNHFENYYSFMESNPEVDMSYFNAHTKPWNNDRNSTLSRGGIGNAELMFKAEVLKKEYQLDAEYEHDWRLVDRIMKNGYKIKKCTNKPTYIIMSVPNYRETNID